MDVLKKEEWTSNVTNELRTFERSLITALKQKGKEIFIYVLIFYKISYNDVQDFWYPNLIFLLKDGMEVNVRTLLRGVFQEHFSIPLL